MGKTNFPYGVTAGNIKYGSTAITGAGTAPTGLASVETVTASLRNGGTAAGQPHTVRAVPGSGGDVVFTVTAFGGTAATAAGTVDWIATGVV